VTFFPLPESEAHLQAPYELAYFSLEKNSSFVGKPGWRLKPELVKNVPWADQIELVLYESKNFQGETLVLPGAGGWAAGGTALHDLAIYGWRNRAAALKVAWNGPPLPTGAAGLSFYHIEVGIDRPGGNYKRFYLKGDENNCKQECAADKNCKAFTWVKPGVQGNDAACWLKSTVTKPVYNTDTVSGVVEPLYAGLSPEYKTPQQPTVQVQQLKISPISAGAPNLTGKWQSSIGAVYEITQADNQFTWFVASAKQKGQGTIQGKNIEASWSDAGGKGSATGTITKTDAQGRAIEIRWNNGVVFFRQ
jgi:hypothetical protein